MSKINIWKKYLKERILGTGTGNNTVISNKY